MLKAHLGSAHVRQPAFRRGIQRGHRELFPEDEPGGGQHFFDRGFAVQRGGKQDQARLLTEPVEARTERALQARCQRGRRRREHVDRVARLRHGARELDEAEGIAGRLGEHATARLNGQPRRDVIEQPVRVGTREAAQTEARQTDLLERGREPIAKAGYEHHRLVVQTPRDERQHVKARTVEPVRVVGDQQQRARIRRVGNEPVCGEGDAERIGLHQVVCSKRRVERFSLRIGKPIHAATDRR